MKLFRTLAATLVVAALILGGTSQAGTLGRVLNGDCEDATSDPTRIPHWVNDAGSPLPAPSLKVEMLGANASAGCAVVGVAVLRSANLFSVTPGENLELRVDVWEARDDDPNSQEGTRGDSVVAIEFVSATGGSIGQVEIHCDDYADILDNGRLDGSDECSALDGYVSIVFPSNAAGFECAVPAARCLKYDGIVNGMANPLTVPAGATGARILLGGSLAKDSVGVGLNSPTSITIFDNVALDTA